MPDGGEGALDRVACTDGLSVFGWEVIEGKQHVVILDQTIGGLVVFGLVLGKKTIEGFLGIVAPLGHPDFSEIRLGSELNRLRELVEDIHRFVNPASDRKSSGKEDACS